MHYTRYELRKVVGIMQLGDILQVQHIFTGSGQQGRNVFFYEVTDFTGSPVSPFAVLDELSTQWENDLSPVLSTAWTSNEIRVDNLTDGLEFASIPTGWGGTITGDSTPAFYSLGFTLARATKLTRNGAKRLSGAPESQVNGNVQQFTAPHVALLEDYVAVTRQFLDFDGLGNNCTWTQRIIGRTLNAQGVYELDLTKINAITSATLNTRVTTQNSRKIDL